MGKLSETELKRLLQGGETNTIELKVAVPRATEMAERLCSLANAQGGLVIISVRDSTHEIVGVELPHFCVGREKPPDVRWQEKAELHLARPTPVP